jgi:xylose isomerase
MDLAIGKAQAAFEFFSKLGIDYYSFHDTDVAPEGSSLKEYRNHFAQMVDHLERHQEQTGVKLLWGTANCFSNPRYAAGAASNPDPEVFAYAAAQVCSAMNATLRLGAPTMCCGAAARAMKPCSTPTSSASANSSGALCAWWWSTSTRSASRATC